MLNSFLSEISISCHSLGIFKSAFLKIFGRQKIADKKIFKCKFG